MATLCVCGLLRPDLCHLEESKSVDAAGGQSASIAPNPLAALPGQPGAHVAKIRELVDNSWLELDSPAADPRWGRARGRSWTSEMPLAPELRGAFLFGEGVHGYTKPDGHYMDDLWFYDINGHRWICCYPGANVKKLDLQINADGFEATADGQPIPVATQAHGYEMNTYDTDLKRLMSMPNKHPYWKGAMPQRERWLRGEPADASPWFYEPATGRWNRLRTGTQAPHSSYGDTLIYVAGRKKAFFAHRSRDVWLYATGTNKWRRVSPEGPQPPFAIDATSCYDSRRDRVYIGGGSYPVAPKETHAFWIFDLKSERWIDPRPQGAPCQGSNSYPTKNAVMAYDSVNDVVLLVFHSFHDDKAERLGVYVYDPQANSWDEHALPVPDKLGRNHQAKNGFYDPVLNAVFIHSAGDSRDSGVIWAYRYKRPGMIK
jgi:hypothetical protein